MPNKITQWWKITNKKLNAGRKESVKTSAHRATELLKVHPYEFITYKNSFLKTAKKEAGTAASCK